MPKSLSGLHVSQVAATSPDGKIGAVLNDPNTIEEITPKMLEERDFDSFFNAPSRKVMATSTFSLATEALE